jgi:hypothetical protein
MEWGEPKDESADVLNVATPDPFKVPVPIVAAPSLNVTVPVGVPGDPVTVAVNVTDWPYVEGLGEDVTLVVVAFLMTRVPVAVFVASATAWTVKVYVPSGVAAVVPMVNVEVAAMSTGLGLKPVVTPVGVPGGLQVVILNATERAPLPLNVKETG